MKKIILAMAGAMLIFACSHNEKSVLHGEEGHSDAVAETHEESVSFTTYSPNFEIFTEYPELQENSESEFLVHITRLEDYSAYSGGNVPVTLTLSGEMQALEATPSGVAGIYHLSITPGTTGEARLDFMLPGDHGNDTLGALLHVGSPGEEDHKPSEASNASLTRYTKEQAWKSKFAIMEIVPGDFSRVVKASGEFMAMPGEKQNVIAKSEGIVLFASRKLVQGSWVNKGESLFTLSGEGLADNNIMVRFNEARVNFEKSKSELQRHKVLLREKIISGKQFMETESQYITDSIVYYSLKGSVGTTGMRITAPMSGYLHELNVSEGQFVKPGNLLATISTNKVILLRADVPQQYYDVLARVVTTTFRPAYTRKVYTLEELSGKLMARGASVAENNHYLPVYFEVVNDGSLLEGAFAEFYLKTEPEPGHIVIPVNALVEEQGNYYVYVQVTGEGYQKRSVELEATDGLYVSVASGLVPGEHIVSEGAMLVKTASSAALPTHSHQH